MSSANVLRVNIAEVATFSTTAPAAGATWIHVPVLDLPLPTLTQEMDTAQEANSNGYPSASYATGKSSGLTYTTRVHTGTKGGSGDTDPTSCFMQKHIESFLGADAVEFEDTTVAGGDSDGNTATLTVTPVVGQAYGVCSTNSTSNDDMEVVFATAVTTNTLTADTEMTFTPALNDLVYGAFNFKPQLGARAKHHYLNVELDGHKWLLGPGRITGMNITGASARQGLRYGWVFTGDKWADGVTPSTFTNNNTTFSGAPLAGIGQMVYVNGGAVRMSDVTINLNVTHEEIAAVSDSTSGANPNGRAGWEITKATASGEFTEYYTSARWDQYTGRTAIPLKFVFRTGSTNAAKGRGTVALYVPKAEVVVEEATINGQRAQKVKWSAISPTAAQLTNGLSIFHLAVFGGN